MNSGDSDRPEPTPGRLRIGLASLAVFSWPVIYLFPYVLPVNGKYLAIGNDFQILYFSYKVYLLDALSHLTLPLWSPSEAAGFPFYSNPFTQTFYPQNLPLALYYKVAGGYQLLDHQRYAVLGIGIFALGLFRWLLWLRLSVRSALFSTLVMSVSFKLTEILRFPNALHTAAWFPWVLLLMGRVVESRGTSARVRNGLLLTGALVCMLTGGYPYYVFYSPWLFLPYSCMLLVPRWSRALLGREPGGLRGSLVTLAVAGAGALAVCGPYLYKVSVLMRQTTDRAGQSFAYSTAHVFDYEDTIGSWVFPPAAQMEGWYYFGMVGVLLILLYLVNRWHPLKLVFVAWIALISYTTYGKSSYLFVALWHHVPMFSSLRVWGRMNIILVPILAWMLGAAYDHFESLLRRTAPDGGAAARRLPNARPLVMLTAIFGVVLAAQLYLWRAARFDNYWITYYAGGILSGSEGAALLDYLRALGLHTAMTRETLVALSERASIVCGGMAFAGLFTLLLVGPRVRTQGRLRRGVLAGLLALSALDVWIVGPWAWAFMLYPALGRVPVDIALRNEESFRVPRGDFQGISAKASFGVGIMDNWYFMRYVDFLKRSKQEPDAARRLLGLEDGRKLFFSERIDHPTIRAFLDDAARFDAMDRVRRYTGDELSVRVVAPIEGYVTFVDNWDADWEASVDNHPVPVERLLGTFKSVRVLKGAHTVRFAYRPFSVRPHARR